MQLNDEAARALLSRRRAMGSVLYEELCDVLGDDQAERIERIVDRLLGAKPDPGTTDEPGPSTEHTAELIEHALLHRGPALDRAGIRVWLDRLRDGEEPIATIDPRALLAEARRHKNLQWMAIERMVGHHPTPQDAAGIAWLRTNLATLLDGYEAALAKSARLREQLADSDGELCRLTHHKRGTGCSIPDCKNYDRNTR